MIELRDGRFQELDRLIGLGLADLPQPLIEHLSKTALYKYRRKAHPRTYKQHIEPWQVRREKYLAAKSGDWEEPGAFKARVELMLAGLGSRPRVFQKGIA
jgi:hypothetical protein